MRSLKHGRALWQGAAVLSILALGLTWRAAGEGYAMRGESEQAGSELAGRIENRIQQSGKPGLEKVRLAVVLHAEKMQTADTLFEALKAQRQDDEFVRLGYAKGQVLAGRAGDGLGHLQELLRQHPNNPTILYELAMVHLRLGGEGQAIALLKRVVEIDLFHARANYELAKWSAARSEPDKAIEYARRVLAVEDPGSPLAHKTLALLDKLVPEKEP